MRYRHLDEKARELVSIGSNDQDFTYRYVMNAIQSAINAAKALRDGNSVKAFGVSAPAISKEKPAAENFSRCVRKTAAKKRKAGACRVCTEAGRTDGQGHRAYSAKCPLFQNAHVSGSQ